MATIKTAKKGKTVPLSKTTPKVAPAKKKKAKIAPVNVRLVSLTVGAVIPTQQYGNIQPSITVEATTIEEARAVVMPVIEDLVRIYAETKPGFLGRVEVTEKIVTPPAKTVEAPVSPSSAQAPAAAPASPAPKKEEASASKSSADKPESVLKAEKAIGLAATTDAVNAIQKQIESSVKIPEKYKNDLIELCYKRFGEVKKA